MPTPDPTAAETSVSDDELAETRGFVAHCIGVTGYQVVLLRALDQLAAYRALGTPDDVRRMRAENAKLGRLDIVLAAPASDQARDTERTAT